MIRNTFTLVCSLFAMFLLLGLSSQSHASTVAISGSIKDANNKEVALLITTNTVTNTGAVSLTPSNDHYYASAPTVSFTLTGSKIVSLSVSGTATDISGSVSITGTLVSTDSGVTYTANFTVISDIGKVTQKTTIYSSAFKGGVAFIK